MLPGGYGTLDELFEALTLVQTGKTRKMPIILVHEPYWRGLLTWMRERLAAIEARRRTRSDERVTTLLAAAGAAVDRISLEPLIGPARVIEIPDSVQAIDAAELSRHEWKGAKRVLFRTRSSARGWMDSSAFHRDFAYIAPDAAQLLADGGVVLTGIDYISAEQFGAPVPRTHQILLGKGIPIIEGLDLRPVQAGNYDLVVLPLKIRGHEGAPARAILRPLSELTSSSGSGSR